jgi:HK97 family phage major capsid protein
MKTYAFLAVAIVTVTAFLFPELAAAAPALLHHLQSADGGLVVATAVAGASADIDLQALAKDFTKATDDVKNLAEDLKKKYETGATVSAEAKSKADDALIKMNEMRLEMDELAQRASRRPGPGGEDIKTAGQIVADSEGLAEFRARRGKMGKMVWDVGSGVQAAITSASNSAGQLRQDERVAGIIAPPQRRMTVRDLLTPGSTDAASITYYRETGFTNNADVVTEGTQKPESTITFESITTNVATIAHWIKASKQILADAKGLRSHIDGRLLYGLALKEEAQLLNGDGGGDNLEGLVTAATAYSAPFALSGATLIDKVRLAMLQAVLAEYPATATVMNPIDWAHIELTKDNEGRYIIGNPQGAITPTLWRVPVVETQAMTVDKFLTGAFKLGAQIFDREDAAVMISDEDGDNFVKNMVTILAEERLALAIYRPESFIYGDFSLV